MKFLVILLFFALSASAQVVISVDENISKNQDKNVLLAVGASAILPGMGELYLGEKQLVRPFVWTDAAFWMLTLGSYFIGEYYVSSAHEYAVRHAGLNTKSKNLDLLNTVGDYRSRSGVFGQNSSPDMDEDYNQMMLRAGKKIDEEFKASIQWDWGSSDNPETSTHIDNYNDRLKGYRISRIVFQASIGALILNRVVSMLDAIRVYRNTSSKSFGSRMKFYPEFFDDGSGIIMNVNF